MRIFVISVFGLSGVLAAAACTSDVGVSSPSGSDAGDAAADTSPAADASPAPDASAPDSGAAADAADAAPATFAIRGTVSGLSGAGLTLANDGGDPLAIAADGAFVFPAPLSSGASYAVTVTAQPSGPTQSCTVTNGTGTVGSADVTDVSVSCLTSAFAVGGTVSGLVGVLVIQDNGGDDLTVSGDGAFAFSTPVSSGQSFAVSVLTQPSGPNQTCVVTGGSGTVDSSPISSVAISCTTNTYSVSAVVTGVQGSGLVLQDNGGDDLAVSSDGTYAFATKLEDGSAYSVTVLTQPSNPDQVCTVDPGGTVSGADVSINVSCQ